MSTSLPKSEFFYETFIFLSKSTYIMNSIYQNGNYYIPDPNFNPPMVNSYNMNYPFPKLYPSPIPQPVYQPIYQPTLFPIMNNPVSIPQRKVPIYSYSCPDIKKPHAGWKNREKFSKNEDKLLKQLVNKYGENDWTVIADKMPHRNCRQCKERWCNYLSPQLNKSKWKPSEDELLIKKVDELGRKWVAISKFFHNRTDQMVKNRYNVLMRIQRTFHNSDSDDSQELTSSRGDSSIDDDEINDYFSDERAFSEGTTFENSPSSTSESMPNTEPELTSNQDSENNDQLEHISTTVNSDDIIGEPLSMESDKSSQDFIDYDSLFDDCDMGSFMVDTPNL